jgi:hypothetical protein
MGEKKKTWNVEERLMDSSPWQCAGAQCTVCQDVSGEAQDPRVGTFTLLTSSSPMWLFLFPKIKSALKGTHFDSVDAVKVKVMEVMKLSEKVLQHCFQQWKICMERCRVQGGDHIEIDKISIVLLVE